MIFKCKKKYLGGNNGFSLMEVIVAIGIIAVAAVGLVSLINFVIISGRVSADKLVAVNLAQEGVEIARNSRDKSLNWNSWISDGNYRAEISPIKPYEWTLKKNPSTYQLNYDSATGFYQYEAGVISNFSRKITVNTLSGDEKQIISQVSWSEHGRVHTLNVESRLYNWK